jgi:hypothetical protein
MTAMQRSDLTSIYDRWVRPYEIRVRGTLDLPRYLWGSAGITKDISFDKPLVLHLRNDLFGVAITFGTESTASGTKTKTIVGTLQPGESASIQVNNMSGVFATCEQESVVACVINQA